MLRIITLLLGLLSISVLLGSSFMTLFDERLTTEDAVSPTAENQPARALASSVEDSLSRRAMTSSRVDSNEGFESPILNALETLPPPSAAVTTAIRDEVDSRLGAFIDAVARTEQQRIELMDGFISAYTDIAQMGANSNSSSSAFQDANYVVNQLGEFLDTDEIAELEAYLEESARKSYEDKWIPQLEIISTGLSPENKELLINTLFEETYGTTNPNGTGAAGDSREFITQQLEAIETTRQKLRSTLTPDQFDSASAFLDEQEAGLHGAAIIFDSAE